MSYDYQLVGGVFLIILGFLGATNGMAEERMKWIVLASVLAGAGLFASAWDLSDGTLSVQDLPQAVYRLIADWR